MSEKIPYEQVKEESENDGQTISSIRAKGDIESTTLLGECEFVSCESVSQGEPLMQKKHR